MSEVIVTVNGTPIDSKALGAAMQGLAQEQFHATLAEVPAENHSELREMATERLIARELIYQSALAEGFIASPEDVEAETMRIVRLAGNPKDFWARLEERGMDAVAFERMVRKDVTVDLLTACQVADLPEPEDVEIERFFREDPQRLQRPDRVKVQHILFLAEPGDEEDAVRRAEEIKAKALAPDADFAALAKLHSACPSAPGGGDLGYIRRDDVDQSFADAVFKQPVDEIGGPIRTPFGVHLVKVTDRDIPGPPTLEESRPVIIDTLKRMEGARFLERWVAKLREDAEIIFPAS